MEETKRMQRILCDLRSTKHSSNASKSKLSTILFAVEETIRERTKRSGEIRAVEYFGAILTALDSLDLSDTQNENLPPLVKLLSIVIPAVPSPVLKSVGQRFETLFIGLWRSAEAAARRGLMSCATYYLVSQSSQAFARPSLLRVLNAVLRGTTDSHSKTRRSAKTALLRVLETQNEIVSGQIVSFAENNLKTLSSSTDDSFTTLHLMGMLKTVAPTMSSSSVSLLITNVLVDTLRKIGPTAGGKQKRMTTVSILETLESVFRNPKIQVSGVSITRVLLECVPTASSSPEYISSWAPALAFCVRSVHMSSSLQDDSNLVAEAAESISRLFANTHPGTLRSVSRSLETLSQCPVPVPSVLESTHSLSRVLHSYGSLLRPTFSHAWKFALPCVGSLIGNLFRLNKNTEHLTPHVRSLILELDDIRQGCAMSESDPELSKICEKSLSLVLSALGVSEFLNIVTFHKRTTGPGVVSIERSWLLAFLLKHIPNSPCNLDYFRTTILALARTCDKRSKNEKFTENERKYERAQCIRLWSLFPCFCVRGSDASVTFPRLARTLATVLADANYPELVPVICRGIVTLIGRVPESTLLRDAMSKFSKNMMPVFLNMIDRHHGVWDELKTPNGGIGVGGNADRVSSLQECVRSYASICDSNLMRTLAGQVLTRLGTSVKSVYEDQKHTREVVTLLAVCVPIISSLDNAESETLFNILSTVVLRDKFAILQKRAYSCLVTLCSREQALPQSLLNSMYQLLQTSLVTCAPSAKRPRLACLQAFMESSRLQDRKYAESVAQLLGEVLLCTKDSNRRTRELAFAVIVSMVRALPTGDVRNTGPITKAELMQMAAAALATATAHMRSAALQGLAVILYEIHSSEMVSETKELDSTSSALGFELLDAVLVLLQEKSREVVKSVLGFLKVAITVIPAQKLLPLVPRIVQGILNWSKDAKNRFRLKVRVLIERLIRKLGADAIEPYVPKKDKALVSYILKERARVIRKKNRRKDAGDEMDVEREEQEKEEDREEEDDDESDEEWVRSMVGSSSSGMKQWIKSDGGDLLDKTQMNQRVVSKDPRMMKKGGSDEDKGIKYDKSGRLVIEEDEEEAAEGKMELDEDKHESKHAPKPSSALLKYRRDLAQRKGGGAGREDNHSGKTYRAKKGTKGDVKKKGQHEPYAYIQFDRTMLGKRRKRQAVQQFGNVLPMTKKAKGGDKKKRPMAR